MYIYIYAFTHVNTWKVNYGNKSGSKKKLHHIWNTFSIFFTHTHTHTYIYICLHMHTYTYICIYAFLCN